MHLVAWTTGSELYEELRLVLSQALESAGGDLPKPITSQMRRLVEVIDADIAERKARTRRVP